MSNMSATQYKLHKSVERIHELAFRARVEMAQSEGSSQIDTESPMEMIRHKLGDLKPRRDAFVADIERELEALRALDLTPEKTAL